MAAQGTATVTSPNGQFTSPFSPTGGWATLMNPQLLLQQGGAALNAAGANSSPFTRTGSGGTAWNPNPAQYSSNPGTGAPSPFTTPAAQNAPPDLGKPIAGINNDPTSSAFYKELYGQATQPIDVSPNDPTIQAQSEAYNAQATGAAKDLLSQAAANGGQFYNPGATTASVAENLGKSTAGFQAQAMADERNARRSAAQQALSIGASYLTNAQQQALQEEIARLNLEEQQYEFGQNQDYLYSPFAAGAGA